MAANRQISYSFLFLGFLLFVQFTGCSTEINKRELDLSVSDLDSLLQTKNYFDAREIYNNRTNSLSDFQKLKVGVFLDYAFNKPDSSAIKSDILFNTHGNEISDSLQYTIESLAHVNFSRLYEYKKAKESLEKLLQKYHDKIPLDERTDLENTLLIWTVLQDQPKQVVVKHKALDIPILRDKAGLQNLMVSNGTYEKNFVFDTGANISTISHSTARELGVHILDGTIKVKSITGQQVDSQLGISPYLAIGNIEVRNVVFLVFPDTALAFPQIDYQIDGILGFPLLEALDEIQITRDGRFIVPKFQSSSEERNLAIDFLTPLVWLEDERGKGVYTFDSGANKTMLYNTYYSLHHEELEKDAVEVDYSFGGAGGQIAMKGIYTTFKPRINNKNFNIDSTIVLKEYINEDNFFLGNIGQDLIGQFDKITINFDQMFIKFD